MKKLGSLLKKFWFKIRTDKDTRGAAIFVGLCVIFYVIFLIIVNTNSTISDLLFWALIAWIAWKIIKFNLECLAYSIRKFFK